MFKRSALTLAMAAFLAAPAHADLTINGFASIKAGMTLDSDDTLYGYDDDLDFRNESLFAVQLSSDLGEKLSVTAQLMGRGAEDFDIGFEWAFLSYQLSDNLRLNAGRLRMPFYKYSDFRDVGYAYDWLRVPQSVYGLGFDTLEGVSLYHTTQLGNFDSALQFVAGSYSGETDVSNVFVDAEIKNILGVAWELGQDWYSFRAAYLRGDVSIAMEQAELAPGLTIGNVFTALNDNGLAALTDAISADEDSGSFMGFGFTGDKNDWVVVAEYTKVTLDDSFIADQKNYYVSVGHRFDSVTPFVSYERVDIGAKTEIYAPYQNVLPPQLLFPVAGIVASQLRDYQIYNVRLRYDFHPAAAFKVQYSSQKDKTLDDSTGLIAVGVDLVF